jgi:pimeloyl-ACP methyl ester carboxylesterase
MCDDSDADNNNMDESQRNSQDDYFLDIVKERQLPYVIVHGEDDSVISVNHAKMMHSFLSSQASYRGDEECKNLFILEECDHLCWITHGHEVVDILGEFWSNNITKE